MTDTAKEAETSEHFDVILEDVETGIRPRKIKSADLKKTASGGWEYASVAGEIGFDVALPMVAGMVVGVKLDEWWGTRPVATLVLFFAGVIIACASLIRIVRSALRKR